MSSTLNKINVNNKVKHLNNLFFNVLYTGIYVFLNTIGSISTVNQMDIFLYQASLTLIVLAFVIMACHTMLWTQYSVKRWEQANQPWGKILNVQCCHQNKPEQRMVLLIDWQGLPLVQICKITAVFVPLFGAVNFRNLKPDEQFVMLGVPYLCPDSPNYLSN